MSAFKFRNIDDHTDYMAKRNEAAAKGDLTAAEGYERDRNYKIDKLGLAYPKTYDYIDVGNEIKVGMENGAPGADIMAMRDYRRNKALTTPGLEKFADDEIQDAATRYYYNDLMGVGGNYQNKPVYENKYGDFVDKMWDRVMNGEEFSYDVENDPNYQVYKDMYTREGKRAMQDTLAQVAQNAGGNNSYAVSAAAQANNYYMQQLADKVPELFDAAYNRYMNEENLKRQDLEIARMLERDDYNRYLGDMGIFQTNVGLANNMIDSQLDREYQERAWDYGVEQDEKNWKWLTENRDYERAWNEDEKTYTRSENSKAQARETALMMIQAGQMPSEATMAAAEWTPEEWQAIVDVYKKSIYNSTRAEELGNEMLEKQIKLMGST